MKKPSLGVDIILGSRVKAIMLPKLYTDLLRQLKDIFAEELPPAFKLLYTDADGDNITVSSQEDYQIALSESTAQNFNLTVQVASDVSRVVMPTPEAKKMPNIHEVNVESDYEPDKKNSVGKQESSTERTSPAIEEKKMNLDIVPDKSTKLDAEEKKGSPADTTDVQHPSSGLPEKASEPIVSPLKKPENAQMEEIKQKPNPTSLDVIETTSVIIEKEASKEQKAEAPLKTINEPKEATTHAPRVDEVDCLSCEGRKTNKKGAACKKCLGTGKISAAFQKHIEKMIQKKVSQIVQEEMEKQSKILRESKPAEEFMSSVSESKIIMEEVACSFCRKSIKPGEAVFVCAFCKGLNFCESCEEEKDHLHALIKSRRDGERVLYSVEVVGEIHARTVTPNSKIAIIWTFKNKGKRAWPRNTYLFDRENNVNVAEIGEIESGGIKDVVLELMAGAKPGPFTHTYQLRAGSKPFGDILSIEYIVSKLDVRAPAYGKPSVADMKKSLTSADNDIYKHVKEICLDIDEEKVLSAIINKKTADEIIDEILQSQH